MSKVLQRYASKKKSNQVPSLSEIKQYWFFEAGCILDLEREQKNTTLDQENIDLFQERLDQVKNIWHLISAKIHAENIAEIIAENHPIFYDMQQFSSVKATLIHMLESNGNEKIKKEYISVENK